MRVDVLGVPVNCEVVGEGRPILILHGWGTDHRFSMDRYERLFAARPGWRRIYPDMPGMGGTPGVSSVASQDDMLAVLMAFVDAVIPGQRFAVIGVSWGGYLALGLARSMGDRLDGLMLTVPQVRALGVDRHLPPRRILHVDPLAIASLQPDEALWPRIAVIQDLPRLESFRRGVKPGLLEADWPFLGRLVPRYADPAAEGPLPVPLDIPALIVTGRHDVAVGYQDAWPLLADLPRATFAVLDGAGHGVEEEQPAVLGALAGEWLDRMEGRLPEVG